MAAAKTKTKAETPVKKNVQSGVIQEWGPFEDNIYVTTQHGDYGIQAGQVLSFEMKQKLNKNTLEMENVAVPVRRKATEEEKETAGVDLSKMQPGKAFYDAQAAKNKPQVLDITVNGGVDGETFPGVLKRAPVKEDH